MIDAFDLPEQDEQLLAACYAHFWQIATTTKPADRAEVDAAVGTLYRALNMSPPVVVWCDSPWQMLALPLVLQMMNVTADARGLRKWLRANHKSDLWQHLWRVMDQHSIALQQLSCAKSTEVPSFFAPLVTGQFINTDMDFLYYTDTQDVQCPDFSEGQLMHIRSATHDRLRMSIIPLKQQMMAKVSQDLNVGLAADMCRPINIFWAGGWGTYYLSQIEFYERHRQGKPSASSSSQRFMRWQPLSRGAQMYLFFEKVAFICERPALLHIDQESRLHNEDAESVRYRDGYAIYSWRGRTVPENLILAPETLTVDEILGERNIEVRQVMLDRFGMERFVHEAGAVKRDESRFGILWMKEIPGEGEARAWVEVINSTPEPDGSYKHYFLRVPPTTITAKQGIAWTFGLESYDYNPLDES